ncbi:hypothetical protein AALB39_17020 [Lachnospiraceae bacterium 54-53]
MRASHTKDWRERDGDFPAIIGHAGKSKEGRSNAGLSLVSHVRIGEMISENGRSRQKGGKFLPALYEIVL